MQVVVCYGISPLRRVGSILVTRLSLRCFSIEYSKGGVGFYLFSELEHFLVAKEKEQVRLIQNATDYQQCLLSSILFVPKKQLVTLFTIFHLCLVHYGVGPSPIAFRASILRKLVNKKSEPVATITLHFAANTKDQQTLKKLSSWLKEESVRLYGGPWVFIEIVDKRGLIVEADPFGQVVRLFNLLATDIGRLPVAGSLVEDFAETLHDQCVQKVGFKLARTTLACSHYSTHSFDPSIFPGVLGVNRPQSHYYDMQSFSSPFFYHEVFTGQIQEHSVDLERKELLLKEGHSGAKEGYHASIERAVTRGLAESGSVEEAQSRFTLYLDYYIKHVFRADLEPASQRFMITLPIAVAFLASLEFGLRNFKVVNFPFQIKVSAGNTIATFFAHPLHGFANLQASFEELLCKSKGNGQALPIKCMVEICESFTEPSPLQQSKREALLHFINFIAGDFGKEDVKGRENGGSSEVSKYSLNIDYSKVSLNNLRVRSRQHFLLEVLVKFFQEYRKENTVAEVAKQSFSFGDTWKLPLGGSAVFFYHLVYLFDALKVEEIPFFFRVKDSRYLNWDAKANKPVLEDRYIYFSKQQWAGDFEVSGSIFDNQPVFYEGDKYTEANTWTHLLKGQPYLEVECVPFSAKNKKLHSNYYNSKLIANGEKQKKKFFIQLQVELSTLAWLCGGFTGLPTKVKLNY